MNNEENATMEDAALNIPFDIGRIMELLPHRYPFLLLDRVVEVERRQRIVAIKNVTANEPFFQGHFPGYPIMPGVLLLEAMAQAGCILVMLETPNPEEKLVVFTGVERARFRRPVFPGDQVRMEIETLNWRSRLMRMQGKAYVDGKLVCEGIVTSQMVPRTPKAASTGTGETGSAVIEAEVNA